MSKKNRKQNSQVASVLESVVPLTSSLAGRSKSTLPTVLFAVGEADFGYSETKILQLANRLRVHGECRVRIATHDQDTFKEAKKLGFDPQLVTIESPGVTVDDRLRATDEMIRETANIDIPGSTLPLWKVLAMDDFLSSLQLFGSQPSETIDADVVLAPLLPVDNNPLPTCGLHPWSQAAARQKCIPVAGPEVGLLDTKNAINQLRTEHS